MECRICLEEDERNNLIVPCKCNGSIKYVHLECLNQMLSINPSFNCRTCLEPYYVKPKNIIDVLFINLCKLIVFNSKLFIVLGLLLNQNIIFGLYFSIIFYLTVIVIKNRSFWFFNKIKFNFILYFLFFYLQFNNYYLISILFYRILFKSAI